MSPAQSLIAANLTSKEAGCSKTQPDLHEDKPPRKNSRADVCGVWCVLFAALFCFNTVPSEQALTTWRSSWRAACKAPKNGAPAETSTAKCGIDHLIQGQTYAEPAVGMEQVILWETVRVLCIPPKLQIDHRLPNLT